MTAMLRPGTRFTVPQDRWATEPPERRGLARDEVRLLVAGSDRLSHGRFVDLPRHLRPGDLLVVNTSATRPAAIDGTADPGPLVVHLSTAHDDGTWTVELRRSRSETQAGGHPGSAAGRDGVGQLRRRRGEGRAGGDGPVLDAGPGDLVALTGGGHLRLLHPVAAGPGGRGVRLWRAGITVDGRISDHMAAHGRPIRYGATGAVGLDAYQTVFARHPGSAEMPSAGRPFSHRLVAELVSRGVGIAPVTLHAGVSSQEAGEPPQPEWADVPAPTAARVDLASRLGHRVIAVGTTVTRALEAAADRRPGHGIAAFRGWTDLVVTPERGVRVVDGIITGWHEPEASHLLLLEAVAGPELVRRAYGAALDGPYLWHEFGDSAVFLP